MKRMLVFSFSPIASDPRVMRQLSLFAGRYAVTVAGFGPPPALALEYVQLDSADPLPIPESIKRVLRRIVGRFNPRPLVPLAKLAVGRFEQHYWNQPHVQAALAALGGRRFDLVVANDLPALPVCLRIASSAPVVFDAHEYAPKEWEDRPGWRWLFGRYNDHLCRTYLPRAAAMTTVSHAIAEEYRGTYGVQPEVVRNAIAYRGLGVSPVEPGRVRLVHHGIATPSRQLETMIDAMRLLDNRFTLDLMLVTADAGYHASLRERAAGDRRIRFVEPVQMERICERINRYDVGIALFPPVSFNLRHCLPNKFFEYVQARLAVATGPSPEMVRAIADHGFGIVAERFTAESLATALRGLDDTALTALKQAADRAAHALSFEAEGEVWLRIAERLA